MPKNVTFDPRIKVIGNNQENEIVGGMKWLVGLLATRMESVWLWAGARNGLQHLEEYGGGFEGWYWRSSVSTMGVGRGVEF